MADKVRRPHYTRQMNENLIRILEHYRDLLIAEAGLGGTYHDERLQAAAQLGKHAHAMRGFFDYKTEKRVERKQAAADKEKTS